MIEIIVMIGVIGWFSKTAKAQNKSGFAWGVTGALSYYIPALLFSKLIFPALIKGSVTNSNAIGLMVLGTFLSVGIGIGFCLFARNMLLSSVKKN